MPTSRSSESSDESETHTTVISMSKRWTTLETVGRCMFLFSVAFFIIGVLITVFGFSNTGIDQKQQIPMKVLGPSCLAMTVVMWGVGCIFSRLWNLEWKRQQQALELRDRVQLHALAMDILNNPVISPGMLQDPRLRRQLLLKLRQQKTLDINSEGPSRRSSKAVSVDSRRRPSSVSGFTQHEVDRRKSKGEMLLAEDKPPFELPGIQISRIETLDLGDAASILSGSLRGSKRYIIVHSDLSSDFSRLSCPSDYSLAGSRSSKSRSSRASSGVSSRLWDFSPRESEWDADISLGSRESQLNVSKCDWGGGPSEYVRDEYTLSPTMPRKMSVVTFDMSEPFRRHSSPAYAMRRKESDTKGAAECICGKGEPTPGASALKNSSPTILKYCDETGRRPSAQFRKKSEASLRSLRIDENDGDDEEADESTPLRGAEVGDKEGSDEQKLKSALRNHDRDRDREVAPERGERDMARPQDRSALKRTSTAPNQLFNGTTTEEEELLLLQQEAALMAAAAGRRESKLRPPLRRNNTDDSEVERRVARLFKEIEFSVSDSVDESKINSQEYEGAFLVRRVEAETQTVTEEELMALTKSDNIHNIKFPSAAAAGRNDSTGSYSDNLRESFDSTDINLDTQRGNRKEKKTKSKLAVISNALANLGRKSSVDKKPFKNKNIPRLFHGLSDESDDRNGATSGGAAAAADGGGGGSGGGGGTAVPGVGAAGEHINGEGAIPKQTHSGTLEDVVSKNL